MCLPFIWGETTGDIPLPRCVAALFNHFNSLSVHFLLLQLVFAAGHKPIAILLNKYCIDHKRIGKFFVSAISSANTFRWSIVIHIRFCSIAFCLLIYC